MKNSLRKVIFISFLILTFSYTLNFLFATENSSEYDIMLIDENKEDEVEAINITEEDNENTETENQNQLMDSKAVDGVYKLSDDETNIYLPFVRYATDRIILDKETLKNLGSVFSATSVEVTEKQEGLKCIFAADTVRVNAPLEYAVIFAGENVVIDSKINGSLIIFGGATVTFTQNAEISGDVLCFTPSLDFKGKSNGSILSMSDKVNVSGTIKNDLRTNCNSLDVSGSDNIKGNVYVETFNKDLNIKEKYSNAIVNVIENENSITKTEVMQKVFKGIIACLVFALLYMLITNKTKVVENSISVVKNNSVFLLMSGALSLLVCPLVFIILLILCMVNLECIALPILILYIAFLLVVGLLSTFIVGSLMVKYLSDTYLKDYNKGMKFLFSFITFAVLYALARIPVVGDYVTWGLVMLANGIVLVNIFKRKSVDNTKVVEERGKEKEEKGK